jgi:hypothetical protein
MLILVRFGQISFMWMVDLERVVWGNTAEILILGRWLDECI